MNTELIISTLSWSMGGLIFFLLGTRIYDLVTPFPVKEELVRDRNTAVGMSMAGYLIGMSIVLHGVMSSGGGEQSIQTEVINSIVFFIVGAALMSVGRLLLGFVLPFDLNHEICEADNPAVGLIEAALYVSVAVIIHGVFIG